MTEGSVPDDETVASETTADDTDEDVEPVELLVQLAEEGRIEPWDIDIVSVTDAYLAHLDRGDLGTSGRALFYASVLLRMKSDAIIEPDSEPDPEPDTFDAWESGDEGGPDPIGALEREMDRRLDRKQARGTPETLEELVTELRDAERRRLWKPNRTYDMSEAPRGFARGTQTLDYRAGDDLRIDDEPSAADVTDTAHAEDIEGIIRDVETALYDQFEAGREAVLYAEIDLAGGSRVQTFLGLLFLANRGQVRLDQDDLFGDLWIGQPLPDDEPGAESSESDSHSDRSMPDDDQDGSLQR
jgi:segregation and condensation protein A